MGLGRKKPLELLDCTVTEYRAGEYMVDCRLGKDRIGSFIARPGEPTVRNAWGGKIPITQESMMIVINAAKTFMDRVKAMIAEDSGYAHASIGGGCGLLNYEYCGEERFNVMITEGESPGLNVRIREGLTLRQMMLELPKELQEPTAGELQEHPLYLSALETGDRFLQYRMELIWGEPTEEMLAFLSERYGLPILPHAAQTCPQVCYLRKAELPLERMQKSGYCLLHRPGFAMRGHTPGIYAVRPHRREIVDSAPVKAQTETVTWEEFLAMLRGRKGRPGRN